MARVARVGVRRRAARREKRVSPKGYATLTGMSKRASLGREREASVRPERVDGTQRPTGIDRRAAGIPDAPRCAGCDVDLEEPFGWCSNCRAAFCAACSDRHFCTEGCKTAGCIAGLCVRNVNDGLLSHEWKRPEAPR